MDRIEMSQDQLLDALQAAFQAPHENDQALTTREMAKALGWSLPRTREHLRGLIDGGQVEPVTVVRMAIDGRRSSVAGYKMVRQDE